MIDPTPARRWASKRQAAAYIGVTTIHPINQLIKSGRIGCYEINSRLHRVDLNEVGSVKDNPQVVMRIELPGGPPRQPLRMRGVSFDRYIHGHWSRTPKSICTRRPAMPFKLSSPST